MKALTELGKSSGSSQVDGSSMHIAYVTLIGIANPFIPITIGLRKLLRRK